MVQFSISPSTNNNSGASTNAQPLDQNELHFLGDGTVEGLDMSLAQSDGKRAHLQLWPVSGLLTLDPGVASQ